VRGLRALSGLVAGGLVILTAVVVAAAILGAQRGFPGPGTERLAWHAGLTVTALVAQAFADRRQDTAAIFGSLVVFVATGYLMVTQWWN
jgi:hypothetical protein